MIKYRNVRTGRVLERPAEDEWLEASAGWDRIDEPTPGADANDTDERMDD